MPLSFAAIFGGTLTLIGTSTNLLVAQLWLKRVLNHLVFWFFQGIIFLIVGTIYNVILEMVFTIQSSNFFFNQKISYGDT